MKPVVFEYNQFLEKQNPVKRSSKQKHKHTHRERERVRRKPVKQVVVVVEPHGSSRLQEGARFETREGRVARMPARMGEMEGPKGREIGEGERLAATSRPGELAGLRRREPNPQRVTDDDENCLSFVHVNGNLIIGTMLKCIGAVIASPYLLVVRPVGDSNQQGVAFEVLLSCSSD